MVSGVKSGETSIEGTRETFPRAGAAGWPKTLSYQTSAPASTRHGLGGPAATVARAVASKVRLDTLLAQRGLFPSRARAAASVMAGEIRLGADGARASKAGQMVAEDVEIQVDGGPAFVSRGGIKLTNALDALGLEVAGRKVLDVGASTGGFTDCLLKRGAEHVVALDVAYGELHWSLRTDERVTVLERCNARSIDPAVLPYRPDLVVADVSFISLTKVLPAVLAACAPRHDALVMVKPQFEVGRERLGKGGVVRDEALRRETVAAVASTLRTQCGAAVMGFASSGLPGPKGNVETFVLLAEGGRDGALDDLEAGLVGVPA
ncbi:MAG: TlyA family rRNA (cytidine-2'-O)-methyltransferase [Actinobacteria bacterium]|nr:TlyA family rRNA (cytidine-2'-O)-methyltransferase [Actinomycetota bacterium]